MLQIENDQYWIDENGVYKYDANDPDCRTKCDTYTRNMVRAAMQNGVNVAVCRVGMHLKSVQELVELAKTYNYCWKIWLMDENNIHELSGSVHKVPKEAMEFMKNGFVKVLPWEQTLVTITYTGNQIDGYYHKYVLKTIAGTEDSIGEAPR
jgi:hypothetical protein